MKKIATLIGIIVLLSACSPFKPIESKPITQYNLNQISHKVASRYKGKKTLLVTMPVASPGYDSNKIIYLKNPYHLDSFRQNQWVAAPAKMLLPGLVQSLLNTRYYHAVVGTPFSGVTDLRLDTQLLKLQHEFVRKPSQVRLIMQAQLINNLTQRVIANTRYEVIEKSPEDNPYGGVIAANLASAAMLEKIALFSVKNSKS